MCEGVYLSYRAMTDSSLDQALADKFLSKLIFVL